MKIKWFILFLIKQALALSYKMMTLFTPIRKDKVVLFNYRQHELEGNMQLLFEEIQRQFPQKTIYIQNSTKKISLKLLKDLWLIRDAAKVVIDDYFLAAYVIKPRTGTAIIQIWHATGAFKKFGLSTKNTPYGPSDKYLEIIPVHSNYEQVYVSTDISATFFAEAFGMKKEQLTVSGVPRVEQLMTKQLQPPQEFSNEQKHMLKVLIAPTYRAPAPKSESTLDWVKEIQALIKKLPNNILLIVVLHPYEDEARWQQLKDEPQLIIDAENSSNLWMAQADCFITDYSSAIFEFALFQRPLANYVPDLQDYIANRGLYRPLQHITDGDILYDRHQLVSWILDRQRQEYKYTERMVEENIGQTTGVTEKIVQHIFMSK